MGAARRRRRKHGPTAYKASPRRQPKTERHDCCSSARHAGLGVRELIAALDKEFGWKCTENTLTCHLYTMYTNPSFARTKADRSANRPIIWSLR